MEYYKSDTNNGCASEASCNSANVKGHRHPLDYCTTSSSSSSSSSSMTSSSLTSSTSTSSSSSSVSPFASAAKTFVTVTIDHELILASNGSAAAAAVAVAAAATERSTALVSSQINTGKRKHSIEKNPETGFHEGPLVKREKRVHSFYQSEAGSDLSSVYPSPVDEFVNDIDTRSSSDCRSSVGEYDVSSDGIPDSPSSLNILSEEDVHEITVTTSNSNTHNNIAGIIEPIIVDPTNIMYTMTTTTTVTAPAATATAVAVAVDDDDADAAVACHSLGERTPNLKDNAATVVKSFDSYLASHYCMTPAAEVDAPRMCPLPVMSWANAQDVWQLMCRKDEQAAGLRNAAMLQNHPGLQPRMRAILLDWLIEVCEVYKLHRETYYLAVDYLDRYLSTQKRVQKTHLQLIGITCLFIAAKVEEIYPPKIGEFAYVTDGACQEEDILQHEILLLQALEWNINPVTAMGWLGVYMQLNVNNRTAASFSGAIDGTQSERERERSSSYSKKRRAAAESRTIKATTATATATRELQSRTENNAAHDAFIYPQFSGLEFVRTAQLLDLCSLDVGMANYPYSVLAAAAVNHTFNKETALRCSGLDWPTILPCVRWMQPFYQVTCDETQQIELTEQQDVITNKSGLGHVCPNIVTDDSHIIQNHTTTMSMFDRVLAFQEQQYQQSELLSTKIKADASPATSGLLYPAGLLTPPASSRKPFDGGAAESDLAEKPVPVKVFE